MIKHFFVLLLLLAGSFARPIAAAENDAMTQARYQEILAAPADAMPLIAPLAAVPLWTNAVITNIMTYESRKPITEVMTTQAHTVRGEFIVFNAHSPFYPEPITAILGYDTNAAALKSYGLYDDNHGAKHLTAGTVVFDFTKKTYTIHSANDDFTEATTGSYTDTDDVSETKVYKNGALFMTRKTITHRL